MELVGMPSRFWVVKKPTPLSRADDLYFECSFMHFARMVRDGLSISDIAGLYTEWDDAIDDADALVEAMSQPKAANNSSARSNADSPVVLVGIPWRFWLVTRPKDTSKKNGSYCRCNFKQFAAQIVAGLDPNDIVGVYSNRKEAAIAAASNFLEIVPPMPAAETPLAKFMDALSLLPVVSDSSPSTTPPPSGGPSDLHLVKNDQVPPAASASIVPPPTRDPSNLHLVKPLNNKGPGDKPWTRRFYRSDEQSRRFAYDRGNLTRQNPPSLSASSVPATQSAAAQPRVQDSHGASPADQTMNPASQTVPCLSPPVPAQAQNVPPAATLSPHSVPAAEETNIAPPPALRAKEQSQSPQTESTRIRSTLISSRRRIVASQAPDGSAATQQTVSSPPLTRNLPHATGRLQTNRPFTPQSSLPALGKTASPATIRPQSADDHPPTSFRRRAEDNGPQTASRRFCCRTLAGIAAFCRLTRRYRSGTDGRTTPPGERNRTPGQDRRTSQEEESGTAAKRRRGRRSPSPEGSSRTASPRS